MITRDTFTGRLPARGGSFEINMLLPFVDYGHAVAFVLSFPDHSQEKEKP